MAFVRKSSAIGDGHPDGIFIVLHTAVYLLWVVLQFVCARVKAGNLLPKVHRGDAQFVCTACGDGLGSASAARKDANRG